MKKFISLLSGGFDSPVAAYLMMMRGFHPVFLSFLTSNDPQDLEINKIIKIIKKFKAWSKEKFKWYVIAHQDNLEQFKFYCERKLTCVLCKRLMLRIAMKIGELENTNYIVTGDILGEQASQTLDNLIAYNDLLDDFLIIRPLIGFNKIDIIKIVENLSLYQIISQKTVGCQYNPKYPETHGKRSEILSEEKKININERIGLSIKNAKILEI